MTATIEAAVTPESFAPSPGKRWYVVHAYSGMEKAVERNLREQLRGDRAPLGGLVHHRAARCECRRDLKRYLLPLSGPLLIDNSGLVQVDNGTLRFDSGLDWHCTAGTGEFRAASTNSLIVFGSGFHAACCGVRSPKDWLQPGIHVYDFHISSHI